MNNALSDTIMICMFGNAFHWIIDYQQLSQSGIPTLIRQCVCAQLAFEGNICTTEAFDQDRLWCKHRFTV